MSVHDPKSFREEVSPMAGALYDERFYSVLAYRLDLCCCA
jgi:hypothetical protein